jgi:very-short-patch-repair endonuclease
MHVSFSKSRPVRVTTGRGGAGAGVDRTIADLAARQHGVVARRQLGALGIGPGRIDGRVSRGQLHPLHRGVYAVGHPVLGEDGRMLAAVLAAGEGAVLSHRSAGRAWRIASATGGPTEVSRPVHFRGRLGILAHGSAPAVDEVEELDGIPITSVSRTLLDLAALASTKKTGFGKQQLEQALNEAEVRGLTSRVPLPELLRRYPGRRGSALLRALLSAGAASRGITRSELERRFAAMLEDRGLPPPRLNATIAVDGRFFEVDCMWLRQRVIVELDGRAAHGTARAFEADRERDRKLAGDGWRVIRVTWAQLHDDAERVADDLLHVLRTAATPR